MRNLIAAGAVALMGGLAIAAPASAQEYYKDYYEYPAKAYDYGYDHAASLDRRQLMREVERQGYYDISDLHPNSFSDDWQAVAYVNGDMVSITIDGRTGRVIDVDEI